MDGAPTTYSACREPRLAAETMRGGWRSSHAWGAPWSECTWDTSTSQLLLLLCTPRGCGLRAPVGKDPKQRPGSLVSLSPCAAVASQVLAPAGTAPTEAAAPGARASTAPRNVYAAGFPLYLWQKPPFGPPQK